MSSPTPGPGPSQTRPEWGVPPPGGPPPALPPVPAQDDTAIMPAGPAPSPDDSADSDSGLMRASRVMAIGTLASRATGFLRTMMMAYALGALGLADAYNNANTLPNIVFDLVLGGILTSVFVPLLVSAGLRDRDGGLSYDQKMFTLVVTVLFGVTLLATLAAAPIVDVYAHALSGPERALTITFARFFIPQVFFYGVSAVAGAILNARGHFAAPMWTPVVNNIVVIAVMAIFLAVAGRGISPGTISTGQVQLLGLGTTLGLAAQVAAMIPALRSIGFRWRFRFDFRGGELTEMGRVSGWLFVYTLTTAVSYLVTMNLANEAQKRAQAAHVGYGAGFTVWNNGWLLFQLPYAIIGFSIITALLPRMSGHASEGRYELVRRDFSGGVRLASVIIAPVALGMAVLAAPLSALLLGHGSTSVASATYMGEVLAVFSVGLLPYMLFQLLLRIFYAMRDSRTAAVIGGGVMVVNVAAAYAALELLAPGQVTAGLAGAFGVGNVAGTVIAWRVLIRRTGGLDGHRIFSSVARMHVAAVPGLIFAIATAFAVGVLVHPGTVNGFLTTVIGGIGGLLLYALFARAIGIQEVAALWETVTERLRR
jgi:putative peptidoglycan lipid II flippase